MSEANLAKWVTFAQPQDADHDDGLMFRNVNNLRRTGCRTASSTAAVVRMTTSSDPTTGGTVYAWEAKYRLTAATINETVVATMAFDYAVNSVRPICALSCTLGIALGEPTRY